MIIYSLELNNNILVILKLHMKKILKLYIPQGFQTNIRRYLIIHLNFYLGAQECARFECVYVDKCNGGSSLHYVCLPFDTRFLMLVLINLFNRTQLQ